VTYDDPIWLTHAVPAPAAPWRDRVHFGLFATLWLLLWAALVVSHGASHEADGTGAGTGFSSVHILTFVGANALLLLGLWHGLRQRQQRASLHTRSLLDSQLALAQEDAHQHLKQVLSRVGDGFLTLDEHHRISYINPHAIALLARDITDELLGRHLWHEYPHIVGTPFYFALEQVMATRQPVLNAVYLTPLGRLFEGRIYPADGGVSIYFTDITERTRTLESLRLSEMRYRLASAPGHVWDWDVKSGRVHFSDAFWRLFGLPTPPAQDVLACFQSLLHPDDVLPWQQALRGHLSERRPYNLSYRARVDGGPWRWFQTQGQAMWDSRGRATFMAGTTFDITQRKAAEAALTQSEDYRRVAFEQLADGVVLTDVRRHIIDANPQMLRMLGYSRAELLGLKATTLFHADHQPRVQQALPQGHVENRDRPWRLVRKDGSSFSAELYSRAVDSQRRLTVVRDITARETADQQVRQLQSELTDLARQLLSQEKATTQRLAQTLHDHLGQTLAVARLNLDACMATHAALMPAPLQAQARQISGLLDQAVTQVRQVLADLRPPLLQESGLADAIANEIRFGTAGALGSAGPGAVDVLLEVDDAAYGLRWPDHVEYAAFMVAREAVANALQHAQASLVRVVLEGDAHSLHVAVIDDGIGISLPMASGRAGHLGMVGMRERCLAIGARCVVAHEPGGGTRVSLHWRRGSS
jgi:PAS domain S-box-containing protein